MKVDTFKKVTFENCPELEMHWYPDPDYSCFFRVTCFWKGKFKWTQRYTPKGTLSETVVKLSPRVRHIVRLIVKEKDPWLELNK